MLWQQGVPTAIVPPSNLKKYAVGIGGGPKASKDAVLIAAARRWPTFEGRNDEADALWLAAMGLDHLTGRSVVPEVNRLALKSCSWPVAA
jgi:Holliday junction resolvasome RuvABC endonuclease subunit